MSNLKTPSAMDAMASLCPILIVEDVTPERVRLAALLGKLGYEVHQASNGIEALEELQQHSIKLVVSDWRMPEMDGICLLQTLQSTPDTAPYFILLTGQDADCDLIAALDAGADDFIRKPCNAEELRARVQAGARLMRLRQNINQPDTQQVQVQARTTQRSDEIQLDLAAAARLQRILLPDANVKIPGLQWAQAFLPASDLAGNCYHIMPLNDRLVAFFHLTVSGRGVRTLMQAFRIFCMLNDPAGKALSLLNGEPGRQLQPADPRQVVSAVAAHVQSEFSADHRLSLLYGVLDRASGAVRCCQLAHPPALKQCANGTFEHLDNREPAIAGSVPSLAEDRFHLAEGERLFIYSDGLMSSQLSSGRQIGAETLRQILAQYRHLPMTALQQQFEHLTTNLLSGPHDAMDICLLALQREIPAEP